MSNELCMPINGIMSSHPYAFIIPAIVLKKEIKSSFCCEQRRRNPLMYRFFAVVSLIGNPFYIIDHFMIYFTSQDTSECKLLCAKGMYDLESKLADAAMHKKITLQN